MPQSCWYLAPEPKTWDEADAYCVERGGHLASIMDIGDQVYLVNYLQQEDNWIGLSNKVCLIIINH